MAEAFSALGDAPHTSEIYRYILAQYDNPKERLATVQNATLTLPAASIHERIAIERRGGAGGELVRCYPTLNRRDVGKAAGGDLSEMSSEREIKQPEASARRGHADDAALLGWLTCSCKDYMLARDWFTMAITRPGNAKEIEGLILAQCQGGSLEQAEALTYQHCEIDPLVRKQFVEIVASDITGPAAKALTSERQAALEAFLLRDQSALGPQAMG